MIPENDGMLADVSPAFSRPRLDLLSYRTHNLHEDRWIYAVR